MALATASTEVVWTRNFLRELGWTIEKPTIVYEDNQFCIHLLSKCEHQRLKHIDVKFNFIRDLCNNDIINYFKSSIITNSNNIYIIYIKDLISNKWRQVIIPLFQKFYNNES